MGHRPAQEFDNGHRANADCRRVEHASNERPTVLFSPTTRQNPGNEHLSAVCSVQVVGAVFGNWFFFFFFGHHRESVCVWSNNQ